MINPGEQINRYRVILQLGKTMISETWQVVDDNDTPKVLKVLLDNYDKLVELFQQEAKVLKQLNHPGISIVSVDVFD